MSEELQLSGEWYIKETEEKLPGTLHINESEKQIYLVLTKLFTQENPSSDIKARGMIPLISGKIDTGGSILLYDCEFGGQHTQMFQRTQVAIGAKYAFWNLNISFEEELKFSKVSVDFGEILEWADLCSFNSDYKNDLHAFKWEHEEGVDFEITDTTSLLIWPKLGGHPFSLKEKEIRMQQSVDFQLSYKEPRHWEEILEDIKILKNLLALGMSRSIYVDNIEYYHESHRMKEIPEHIRPMKVYCGTGAIGKHKPGKPWEFLFTLKDLTDNDFSCLKNWFAKYTKLKPVVELSTVAFHYRDISAEMLFLNLAQGLETYHARFVSNDPQEYFKIVDELLMKRYKIDGAEHYSEQALSDRSYMISEKNEEKAKQIHLRSRLGYLFYMNDEVWTAFLGFSREEFLKKMVDTRNYYTHYSEDKEKKKFSKEQMPYVNGILMAFLHFYILKEMNMDYQKNLDSFRKKMININNNYKDK